MQAQELQSFGVDSNGPIPFSDDNIVNVDPVITITMNCAP